MRCVPKRVSHFGYTPHFKKGRKVKVMSKEVKWTYEQLQAIEKTGNNILVAAAAGSGKTAVLVERIINKIINQKINIDEILVVTFTNAAASEMRERILEAIYKKIEEEPDNTHLQKQINLIGRASICTIDSFCLDVVKNNFYEIDISPNFGIADNAELELIKQECLEELFDKKYETEDKDFLKLLETYTTYSADEPLKELILNIYNFIQSHPFPNEWLEEQVEKYNLERELEKDFSETEWGKIIISNFKEELLDSKVKLEQVKNSIEKFEELKKYALVLSADVQELDNILKLEKWDEIYNAISEITFEKWPIDRKITLEEKEIAKEKRNEIRKQIKQTLEIIDCNSKQANQDIYDMYQILKSLKNLIFEYDELLKQAKKEKNLFDFSDIEHNALKILLKKKDNKYIPSEIAIKYKNKFKEIAIDEYQDSNLVQESILTSISNGKNIFMVGDVKQSIYKFRQARPELFLDKYEKYTIEDDTKSKGNKIQLFKNFRSRANILDTTNLIFKEIMSKELGDIDYTEEEYLNLGANFEETKKTSIKANTEILIIDNKTEEVEDEENEELEEPIQNIELEAKFVAKKIKEILNSKQIVFDKKVGYRPITYKDIVILLRSTKDKANVFENELINLDIPVYSDASLEYLNSIEIQTIMNLLKVIDNPTVDIPLVSVLRSMIGGFTDNELIQIRLKEPKKSFYEAMKEYSSEDIIKEKIDTFLEKISSWKKEAEYLELDELIWKIYIDTGYYNYVSLMPDGILRQANLKLLFEKAKQYEKVSFKGLYNFISFIEKVRTSSGDLSSAKLIGENENVVRIMSIHKSKGLEFPLVFLCNSNKKFNVQDLNNQVLLHQDLGLGSNYIDSDKKLQYSTFAKEAIKIKSKEEIISEEMRILYVALTRAKERLIVTGISNDLDKSLKEKDELLNIYSKDEKININLLKKYKSYLDWIQLVYLKNKQLNIMQLEKINKQEVLSGNEEKLEVRSWKLEDIVKDIELKNAEEIRKKIDWQYEYLELSKIEGKTSVSEIKQLENKDNEFKKTSMKLPEFLKEENTKLTGAQKGTLIHLCMQHLSLKEEYTEQKVKHLIETLVFKNKISSMEAENIDITKILNFTKSNLWQDVKRAKLVEREKPFYTTVSVKDIYDSNIDEEILVQGIIDLYYVSEKNELVLVDYKTDYVTEEKELIEKYNTQLNLYKKAIEEALNKNVSKVYIYSTCLNREILTK